MPPSATNERATTAYHPLPEFRDIDNVNDSSNNKQKTKSCLWLLAKILAIAVGIAVIVTGIWQFVVVKLGHSGCSAQRMEALEPEFGKFDLLPKSFVMIEQSHRTYNALEVFPTDEQGKITGGSIGYYYKYHGPWWNVYGLTDELGNTLLTASTGWFSIGKTVNVHRCDESAENPIYYSAKETSHWLMNKIRKMFGSFINTQYSFYSVNKETGEKTLLGLSVKQGFQAKQLVLRVPDETQRKMYDAVLVSRHWMNQFDYWLVHCDDAADLPPEQHTGNVPSSVFGAVTAVGAFRDIDKKGKHPAPQVQPRRGAYLQVSRRHFAYEDTPTFWLKGHKKTVLTIQPMFDRNYRLATWHAKEALGLGRAAKWDNLPGPFEPEEGWDNRLIATIEEANDALTVQRKELMRDSEGNQWLTVKSEEEESDDEYDMDDPLWANDEVLTQWAQSCVCPLRRIHSQYYLPPTRIEQVSVCIARMPPKHRVGFSEQDEIDRYEDRDAFFRPEYVELLTVITWKVLDRQRVVLEVFALRAKTGAAEWQVRIARLAYMRINIPIQSPSHTKGMQDMLSRFVSPYHQVPVFRDNVVTDFSQHTMDETNELLNRQERECKRKLEQLRIAREKQRARRREKVTVALVGYTNSGKTALLNRLTGANKRVRDLLFQTTDTTWKRLMLPSGAKCLVVDGVGFIRDLPHFLFDSFYATIEELVDSDVILHVRDMSSETTVEEYDAVIQSLKGCGFNDEHIRNRIVEVWNKVDKLSEVELHAALAAQHEDVEAKEPILVSAKDGTGIKLLTDLLDEIVNARLRTKVITVEMPVGDTNSRMQFLNEYAEAVYDHTTRVSSDGKTTSIDVLITEVQMDRYMAKFHGQSKRMRLEAERERRLLEAQKRVMVEASNEEKIGEE
ncbi:putative GTP-binding protein 6 [Perkinsus chesapeaki]|uniref:Putative GTP-binding protein 6 n=1 Tax=Perkinsus chesapeaki TaxID=330153 RepID=A0A7J6LKR7_PERCH|nr:putative GTP-binding protein 6 [Perkinsus chesapeaki]